MAERVGFEPTEPVKAHSISNAANSTTLAPFRKKLLSKKLWIYFNPQSQIRNLKSKWRRGWDSNPRNPQRLNNFRDCPIQPLSHLSARRNLILMLCGEKIQADAPELRQFVISSRPKKILHQVSAFFCQNARFDFDLMIQRTVVTDIKNRFDRAESFVFRAENQSFNPRID